MRFPIDDPLIEMFEVLDPDANCFKFPSLVAFPNILSDTNLHDLFFFFVWNSMIIFNKHHCHYNIHLHL